MKISLDKELERESKKQRVDLNPIREVKLLLEGESVEDARILRGLSDNSQFNRVEKIRGQQIQINEFEKSYLGKVYKIDEIEKLCVDYRLRFLRSKFFTGAYDVEVAAKIKNFAKETNSPIDEYSLKTRYFIMAPAEMFALKEVKHVSKRQLDPVIFFKIDDEHYRIIHKWGNDFSIFRLLQGMRWKNWWSYQWFNTFLFIPFLTIFWFMLKGSPAAVLDNNLISSFLGILVVSFLLSFFTLGVWKLDDWDVIPGYFGQTNWDSDSKIKR